MNEFVDKIKIYPDYVGANGRTTSEIVQAESILGISFAEDYRCYLSEIGLACFNGHELTGITNISRVDIITVTQNQKGRISDIPDDWYVVEETNIDNIVIWQNALGQVFQTSPRQGKIKIANSLVEYIEQ